MVSRFHVNPQSLVSDQGDVSIRRTTLTLLCLASLTRADLQWTFSSSDLRPGSIGGVYGYVYPSASSPGQTTAHRATLKRFETMSDDAARLSFHLDGPDFPGAGFGLMFENAAPLDMRGMTAVTFQVRADRERKLRFSLAPSDSALKIAADTGVTFGRDTTVGTAWTQWTIQASDLAWPRWAADAPSVRREDLLARVFALQFDIGCESKNGSCSDDSGFIEIDDVVVQGAGGRWNAPAQGDCGGDTLWVDRFASGNVRQNDVRGWWYAYTDRTSSDTTARGFSKILNASDPDSAETWDGPDSGATMSFKLARWKVYSGYAAIETQLAEPDAESRPQARSYPGAKAISFRVGFPKNFPEALGGVVVHLRKKGKFFENGRDHQIQIPLDSVERTWCLDLGSFKQPNWSEWIQPFSTDSLTALSFEVRLPSSLDFAQSSFRVSDIAFHGTMQTGIGQRLDRHAGRLVRTPSGWAWIRPEGSRGAIAWRLQDLSGRLLASGSLEDGRTSLAVPAHGKGIGILALDTPWGRKTFRLLGP